MIMIYKCSKKPNQSLNRSPPSPRVSAVGTPGPADGVAPPAASRPTWAQRHVQDGKNGGKTWGTSGETSGENP